MIKHIIFDCDGVLIDTEIVAAEVVVKWFATQDYHMTVEEFIVQHTGKMFSHILRELVAEGKLPAHLDIQATMDLLEPEVKNNMRPIAGVSEVLSSIALPKSVVSNSGTEYVAYALEKFGWAGHFKKPVFSAELVEKGKPSPLIYQLALETLGVDKSEVIAIEDSYTGVQAATAAGIKTIGFLGGSHIMGDHAARLQTLGVIGLAKDHEHLSQLLSEFLS